MGRLWARAMGLGAVALCACACARAADQGPGAQAAALSDEAAPADGPRCDPGLIQALESDARALANPAGCTDVRECRTAPVGVQACGGPRDYVVYCSASTDEKALLRSLDQLARREDRYNRQCDIVSICIFYEPPPLALVDGVCQRANITR